VSCAVAPRVTLRTVADRVGVSRMTVSNAFSRPDQLSPSLRERILATAAELGYVGPDPTARALARGSSGAVGVLLTDSLEDAFLDEVATRFLGAVAAGLQSTGLALTLLTTATGPVLPARELPLDGAIIYSCRPSSESRDWLIRRRLPLVYVDQPPAPEFRCVNIDDRGGARQAARHVLDLGHRQVAVLADDLCGPYGVVTADTALDSSFVARERLGGWLDELGGAGIRPTIMVAQPRSAPQFADRLFDLDQPPTAVLCYSDVMALTVIAAARRRGLTVPRDVSVVGFDDAPMAARVTPGLTTVGQDIDAKGRLAASALVEEIAASRAEPDPAQPAPSRPGDRPVEHVVLPTGLVVRESTAPPRRRRPARRAP
jgi:DNA-binding LacI/PurR family transcriptional regulator